MDLSRIIPERFFRYQWQRPEAVPYDPASAVPFPLSRHAWGSIGHAGEVIPDGDDVAAVPLQPDGTRGILTLWADWFKGIGGTNNTIQIALLNQTLGDAVPPLFAINPTNCKAGRIWVDTQAGEPASAVATVLTGMILTMLTTAGLIGKFNAQGGEVVANFARADLGPGTIAILSPAPWKPTSLSALGGAWGNIGPDAFESHQGNYRPEFLAGVRPAPWLVVGNVWAGRGEHHSIIG